MPRLHARFFQPRKCPNKGGIFNVVIGDTPRIIIGNMFYHIFTGYVDETGLVVTRCYMLLVKSPFYIVFNGSSFVCWFQTE